MPKTDVVQRLLRVAKQTLDASNNLGSIDKALDKALDDLREAVEEAKYHRNVPSCPVIEILTKWVRSPGGRGHYEGTIADWGWMNGVRGNSEELVIGKLVKSHMMSGNPPAMVVVRQVNEHEEDQ